MAVLHDWLDLNNGAYPRAAGHPDHTLIRMTGMASRQCHWSLPDRHAATSGHPGMESELCFPPMARISLRHSLHFNRRPDQRVWSQDHPQTAELHLRSPRHSVLLFHHPNLGQRTESNSKGSLYRVFQYGWMEFNGLGCPCWSIVGNLHSGRSRHCSPRV